MLVSQEQLFQSYAIIDENLEQLRHTKDGKEKCYILSTPTPSLPSQSLDVTGVEPMQLGTMRIPLLVTQKQHVLLVYTFIVAILVTLHVPALLNFPVLNQV